MQIMRWGERAAHETNMARPHRQQRETLQILMALNGLWIPSGARAKRYPVFR
jgi:hypothetical protein